MNNDKVVNIQYINGINSSIAMLIKALQDNMDEAVGEEEEEDIIAAIISMNHTQVQNVLDVYNIIRNGY